ncbi:hypothetical protein [Halalkalicoccus subterraneus]|uniref:hypothetical protein n=1 Tax=Halalkalicoccus subterraneus TaxID=2675002 RepID=UPI000EFC817E|nr:hypothetical protein [Halalkalicoccus subterraneus]
MNLRDRLGLSSAHQRYLAWLMELSLVGMFFIGLERGATGVLVNTGVALVVTQLPPLLKREYGITMDAGLILWITAAVFLHALGTVGLPGSPLNLYRTVWWWDHLTHGLSASVVAAVGYAAARAVDLHTEDVHLPPRFMFVFILLFVLAFGVFWEVIEFALGSIGPALGFGSVLTQYGLEDTMLDLVFNTIGAIVVAIWGTSHLNDLVDSIAAHFETR